MNYFDKQTSYTLRKFSTCWNLLSTVKPLTITKVSRIPLSYGFLKVFQTIAKTIFTSQSQIEFQIMQMLAKHTQALNVKSNTQQLNVIIQSKKLFTYS
jgi:hypothetical protein